MWRYHVKYRVVSRIKKGINMDTTQLKRIADALAEILKLVKQDMKKYEKKKH